MSEPAISLREAVAKAAQFFKDKGIETARLDAELLLGEATGLDRLQLYLNLDRPLSASERAAAREFLRRRAAFEPVAYILGRKEFCSREYRVGPGVLVPRPETEHVVEAVQKQVELRFGKAPDGLRILELGTGSGAIAVSLAADIADCHIIATEASADAAAIARSNAESHGVASKIEFRVQTDFAGIEGPFHVIASNPPYIALSDRDLLPKDVLDFEPPEALFAAEDGLACYRFILGEADALLLERGCVVVEIGRGQGEAVSRLGAQAGLRVSDRITDYAGIERVLVLEKQQPAA
jgi:release factor glutamine methyltransferase